MEGRNYSCEKREVREEEGRGRRGGIVLELEGEGVRRRRKECVMGGLQEER